MFSLACLFNSHKWDNGCVCKVCGKTRDYGHDLYLNCEKCSACGKSSGKKHDWTKDCEKCCDCKSVRHDQHNWSSDCNKCSVCNTRSLEDRHDWSKNCRRCAKCGKIRHADHKWSNGLKVCSKCGLTEANQHDWIDDLKTEMEICGVSIRLSVLCESCNTAVPVNGICTKVKCYNCQEMIGLSKKYQWKSILNYHNPSKNIFEASIAHKYGTGDYGAWIKAKLDTQHLWPECFKCNHKFEKKDIEKAIEGDKKLNCPKCSHSMQLKAVPTFFSQEFPLVFPAYFIDRLEPEIHENHEKKNETKPVIIRCAACGGALQVDGSKRMVQCTYCSSSEYLPDGLWLSLHPTPKREKWYIIFYDSGR